MSNIKQADAPFSRFLSLEIIVLFATVVSVSSVGLYKVEALAEGQQSMTDTHVADIAAQNIQNAALTGSVSTVGTDVEVVKTNQAHFRERMKDIGDRVKEIDNKQDRVLMLLQELQRDTRN